MLFPSPAGSQEHQSGGVPGHSGLPADARFPAGPRPQQTGGPRGPDLRPRHGEADPEGPSGAAAGVLPAGAGVLRRAAQSQVSIIADRCLRAACDSDVKFWGKVMK